MVTVSAHRRGLPAVAKSPSAKAGFTLVELLVVIVIIGILAGLLIPIIGIALNRAAVAACAHNLSQLYKTGMAYTATKRGHWPPVQGEELWLHFQKTTPPLLAGKQKEVCFCPRKGEMGQDGSATDYRGPAVPIRKLESTDPLGGDKPGNHGETNGGNLLLMDGSVQEIEFDDELWQLAIQKLSP